MRIAQLLSQTYSTIGTFVGAANKVALIADNLAQAGLNMSQGYVDESEYERLVARAEMDARLVELKAKLALPAKDATVVSTQ